MAWATLVSCGWEPVNCLVAEPPSLVAPWLPIYRRYSGGCQADMALGFV